MKAILVLTTLVVIAGCKGREQNSTNNPTNDADATSQPQTPKAPNQQVEEDDSGKEKFDTPKPEGKMDNGLRQGQWTFFHSNGKKAAQGEYKDGLKNGRWIFWYDNGEKTAEGSFRMGKKVGQWIDFDEKGKEVSRQTYVDGVRVYK